jgi:F-type H+-transporting ATPase subunit b
MADAVGTVSTTMSGDLSASVGARVEEIMASARQAAEALQREVEEAAARRATEVRLEAERDAQRIREQAQAEAGRHLAEAHARVQAFADARVRRITELTDALIAAAETIPTRLGEAVDVRRQVDELIVALGAAAEQAAREAGRPAIRLPGVGEQPPAPEDPA